MSDTLDLFTYPQVPGAKVSGTSREAAESMKEDAATLRTLCLAFLSIYPKTADQCAAAMDQSVLSVRPRFSELRAMGLIVDTGERRLNYSGRKAIVWDVARADARTQTSVSEKAA